MHSSVSRVNGVLTFVIYLTHILWIEMHYGGNQNMKYDTLMHLKYHLSVPLTLHSLEVCNINERSVITHLYGTTEKKYVIYKKL